MRRPGLFRENCPKHKCGETWTVENKWKNEMNAQSLMYHSIFNKIQRHNCISCGYYLLDIGCSHVHLFLIYGRTCRNIIIVF